MSAPESRTPYAETEALLAVMEGDIERATELVAGFLPRERHTFELQVGTLLEIVTGRPQRVREIPW